MAADKLKSRLDAGEILILDGAIGTELERLGAPMHNEVWCAEALESHPDLVRQVHKNYIDAGADVITTNTYASARHAMERAGVADKVEEWNARAARLAIEARDQHTGDWPVYVAGAVSSFGKWGEYDAAKLRSNYQELAKILADNGVDLILLEMLAANVEDTIPAVEAATATGLPVWVGLSSVMDRGSDQVMLGIEESQEHSERASTHESFAGAVEKIMAVGGSAQLVMHSDLKATKPAVQVMKEHYEGVLGAYPNAGYWMRPNWAFVDQVTPDEYLAEAKQWVGLGAQIVGGCCGIGPDHIKVLRDGLPARIP